VFVSFSFIGDYLYHELLIHTEECKFVVSMTWMVTIPNESLCKGLGGLNIRWQNLWLRASGTVLPVAQSVRACSFR